MDFQIGDVIYKKKYRGNELIADKTKQFQITYIHHTPLSHNTTIMATLDDNTHFELMDSDTVYAEHVTYNLFCCITC